MSQSEIENFMYDDLTFHKKTQKFGNRDVFFQNYGVMQLKMNCYFLINLKTLLNTKERNIVTRKLLR